LVKVPFLNIDMVNVPLSNSNVVELRLKFPNLFHSWEWLWNSYALVVAAKEAMVVAILGNVPRHSRESPMVEMLKVW
jgi:hypothetical protein